MHYMDFVLMHIMRIVMSHMRRRFRFQLDTLLLNSPEQDFHSETA
jgi:hypothetical protein